MNNIELKKEQARVAKLSDDEVLAEVGNNGPGIVGIPLAERAASIRKKNPTGIIGPAILATEPLETAAQRKARLESERSQAGAKKEKEAINATTAAADAARNAEALAEAARVEAIAQGKEAPPAGTPETARKDDVVDEQTTLEAIYATGTLTETQRRKLNALRGVKKGDDGYIPFAKPVN